MLTQTSDTDGTGPDLIDEVGAEIQVTLDRWSVGHIGWSEVIAAAVVFAAVAVVAWIMRRLVGRWTKDWEGPAAAAASLLGQVVSLGLYLFATAIALELLGFTVGPVLMIIALITVVFLFLQPVVRNLSSGFVLQLRGSLKPGDLVETGEVTGVVEEISTRAVVLSTNDGRTVHIPNNQFVDETLINYTTQGRRRSEMSMLLPERADVAEVAVRVTGALHGTTDVLKEPAPEVVVTGFDGAQPRLQVLFWHAPELAAERAARNRVGHALAGLARRDEVTLADPSIVVRADVVGD
jgi:small-conductance mechanosensitive channel